jgi:charged multivesicular body protein 5
VCALVLSPTVRYEKQRDTLYNQSFNVDQTRFALQNVKDTVTTVAAMKSASTQLKVSMKEIDLNEVEDLHDDMSDMLEDADEINEIMGRAYGVPDELNEDDLMDELGALEDELALDESEELPAYLLNAASAAKAQPAAAATVHAAPAEVDAYGLPDVPMRKLNA